MGYYTNYSLEIRDIETLNIISDDAILDQLYQDHEVFLDDDCKWYEHESDMIQFSKKYPNYYFYFRNRGEQSGDLWYSLFNNGKLLEKKNLPVIFPILSDLIKPINKLKTND